MTITATDSSQNHLSSTLLTKLLPVWLAPKSLTQHGYITTVNVTAASLAELL